MEKYSDTSRIRTVEDVQDFFRYLASERKLAFHPDDTFESYDLEYEERKRFDRLLDECFTVCDEFNVDIYQLAINALEEA